MKLSLRRAEWLALIAFVLHIVFSLLLLAMSAFCGSVAVSVEAWHFLGGSLIWLILLLQFRQRRLAQEELADDQEYRKAQLSGKEASIFEASTIDAEMQLAQRRSSWLEKYLLGIFAVLLSGFLLAVGYWQYRVVSGFGQSELAGEKLLVSAAYLAGFALVSFLFSRYATGMSQHEQWRPLRAGGSYLFSNALACFALAVVMLAGHMEYTGLEKPVAYVLVAVMMVIGVETLLNFVLDLYRPRVKGQYRRAAYESRLLGLFCEPQGLLRTAAHAIDYQFGFKVSETWFFKLLEKAVLPLIMVQCLVLYLMTCLAIVQPGHEGVLERFGVPLNIAEPYKSGLHFKYPWPIDSVRQFPVEAVQLLEIGFEREPHEDKTKPLLWTVPHWKQEFPFMVAVPEDGSGIQSSPTNSATVDIPTDVATDAGVELSHDEPIDRGIAVARNNFDLVVMELMVLYRITDISKYAYSEDCCQDPLDLLESICYRQVVHYSAYSDLAKLMGPDRDLTTNVLKKNIQADADKNSLGMEIVFVGIGAVHPPLDVAEEFEKVVMAWQQKQALVLAKQGESAETIERARGTSKVLLSGAKAYKVSRVENAQASAERFSNQMVAYEKGKDVYLWREYLSVLDESLSGIRKYILASDNVDSWVYEVDLKEKLQPSIFDDFGISEQENDQ